MKTRKILLIVTILILLLMPTGAAIAIPAGTVASLPPPTPTPTPTPAAGPPVESPAKPPAEPKPKIETFSANDATPWCLGSICFNPAYFVGSDLTFEKDGNSLKITTSGDTYVSGQLSFLLPKGTDANTCTFYKDGVALSNTVFTGNAGNVYIYISQPPESIDGTYTVNCAK